MANKVQKYREEYKKNNARIARIKERNDELDRKIMEEESLEIRALMHSVNITLDELAVAARSWKANQKSTAFTSDTEDEVEDDDDDK